MVQGFSNINANLQYCEYVILCRSKGYFCCLSLLMHLNLVQIITLKKGVTMNNEGSHIILNKGGAHCLLKKYVSQGLTRKGALRLYMFLLRIHIGHHALLQFLLSLSLAILGLVFRMITTDIINHHRCLSPDTFLLFEILAMFRWP